jgi:hypothetical protein
MPNLRDSIRLAKQAEHLGYHAPSALPPHSYPFSDDEIFAYYQALSAARAVSSPGSATAGLGTAASIVGPECRQTGKSGRMAPPFARHPARASGASLRQAGASPEGS